MDPRAVDDDHAAHYRGQHIKTMIISREQQQILSRAPRFLFYHTAEKRKGLIPDTAKARAWAVKTRGANRMNCLTFNAGWAGGSEYRFGDLYLHVSHQYDDMDIKSEIILSDKLVETECVVHSARQLFDFVFGLSDLNFRCTYLAPRKIGVCIPASVFVMNDGAFFLYDFYRVAASMLLEFAPKFDLNVRFPWMAEVENSPLDSGKFAIPFLRDEVKEFRKPLDQLAAMRRFAPSIDCTWQIGSTLLTKMRELAIDRYDRRRRRARKKERLEPDHPTNSGRVYFCDSTRAAMAHKCAEKLKKWISRNGLTEFGQRDAQRAARRRLDGPSGEGGGVADALRILVHAGYILECPESNMEYFCKRPSPWFLVTPSDLPNRNYEFGLASKA